MGFFIHSIIWAIPCSSVYFCFQEVCINGSREDHWKSLKAWIKGSQVIAPQEIAEKRWEICKQCPHLLYDETNPDTGRKDGRCTHCGCFMNVKVHYAVAECPIDRWPDSCKYN